MPLNSEYGTVAGEVREGRAVKKMPPKITEKPTGYVVIHGHFYQPPRENPWIEQIEEEVSARPYHDWNARVTEECYTPNGCARIYDGNRRILDIVNNYKKLSFNFGPTLLTWLEVYAPLTYQRLLAADRLSLAHLGHGNAIAQAYNHIILPLANHRDRETEVIWGLKDFRHRFGREAEAMWLPETAVDYPTLEILAAHGMKYVILSPYQARRVRPLEGGAWEAVQAHTLDTTQAYRCFLPSASGAPEERRYIDVFFYNGRVASDLSFGDLLGDSQRLVASLEEGFRPDLPRPQLLHVATDGENYGHHHNFGELALAYALDKVVPQQGFTLTNYAAFLEVAPPKMRVELELGPKGEGSSWSCAHGVGRWKEDCGCSTGGPPTWNQRWRTHLREAFDYLNTRLARIFEEEGAAYLKDPWAARNDYLEVILDRREETILRFFSRHGHKGLTQETWFQPLRLLEMQRHTLLMYTSCGWFFADLAGLETIQVMKYAARALQLGQHFSQEPLEEPFLQRLEQADSNITGEGNGRAIFLRRVKPAVVDFPKVVNQWAISWLKNRERQCPHSIYHFRVRPLEQEFGTQGTLDLASGRLRVTSGITWREETLSFFTVHLGSYLYRTQIFQNHNPEDFQALKEELFQVLAQTPEDLIPFLATRLGERYYTVHDIFQEEKEQIFLDLLEENREEALGTLAHHFGDATPILRTMAKERLLLPRLYQALGEITLNRRLVQILRRLEPEPDLLPTSEDMLDLLQEADLFGFKLESREGAQILRRILHHHLTGLGAGFQLDAAQSLMNFLKLQKRIPITLDVTEAQNFFFGLLKEHFSSLAARSARDPDSRKLAETVVELAEALNFSPEPYQPLLT
jgi:alpha-amylase/alpha-mannosidase (GH57 family)